MHKAGKIPVRGVGMRAGAILWSGYCAVLLCGTATLSAPAYAAQPAPASTTTSFDIRPQGLGSALNALALQAHQQILFTPEVIQGKFTAGVKGALTVEQALTQLLAGTGLSFSRSTEGMILVSPADVKGA